MSRAFSNLLKHIDKLKLSKEELVDRLIQTEQYVANKQKEWVSNHFEMFK